MIHRGDRLVLLRGDDLAVRSGHEVDHRQDAARAPVLDYGHTAGRVSGGDLLGKILGDLELERLVERQHQTRTLPSGDDVGRRAWEPFPVRAGRHYF